MKLVGHSGSIGWKVHELAWNLHKFEFALCEVILPKEYYWIQPKVALSMNNGQ